MVCKQTHRGEAIKIEKEKSWKLSDKRLQGQDAKARQGTEIEIREAYNTNYWEFYDI